MSLSIRKIEKAVAEAHRFINAATMVTHHSGRSGARLDDVDGDMHTAAIKRASMDLTRALAEMRKP